MALTNPQYDAIMRMYNERQLRHQREQQEHIRIAYETVSYTHLRAHET